MTIPELTARIAALETIETDLTAKLTASTADLTAAQSLADEVQTKLTAETAKSAELASKLTASEQDATTAKAAASLAAKDLALAREASARFGTTPPAKTDAGQKADEKPTLTRSQFEELPHPERNEFFRNGGKLTE